MKASDFLPGTLRVERGTYADYRELRHLHYAPGDPAVVAGVWRAEYSDLGVGILDFGLNGRRADAGRPHCVTFNPKSAIQNPKSPARLVGVGVLAYPTPALRARERALGLGGPRYGAKLAFANAHVRRIARVIVHPQFRALGVATLLVRRMLGQCPTRYVEAVAVMGDVVPMFQRAGMTRIAPAHAGEPAYFLFDRLGELRLDAASDGADGAVALSEREVAS